MMLFVGVCALARLWQTSVLWLVCSSRETAKSPGYDFNKQYLGLRDDVTEKGLSEDA